jgi:hypothetical protein
MSFLIIQTSPIIKFKVFRASIFAVHEPDMEFSVDGSQN